MHIPLNGKNEKEEHVVYISSNGVHLDIIVPKDELSSSLKAGLIDADQAQFFAFGWGDENFYLNTPTWADLKAKHALQAMFWKSTTLMHVTRFQTVQQHWIPVYATDEQVARLCEEIQSSFKPSERKEKILIAGAGYTEQDDFYKAWGNYSCLKTCNTWANAVLRNSGLRACLWTPFDFGLVNLY